jgi:hypothetical protein
MFSCKLFLASFKNQEPIFRRSVTLEEAWAAGVFPLASETVVVPLEGAFMAFADFQIHLKGV